MARAGLGPVRPERNLSVMTDCGRVVVAGAGLAGLRTAEELRERGFAGRITLIGAESRPPYDRPPLSKKVLTEPALDPSLKADFTALDVDFRPDEAAVAHGSRVTVVEAGPAPLAAAIGAPVGAQTARWYAAAGVDLRVATAVEAIQPGGLALAGGEH